MSEEQQELDMEASPEVPAVKDKAKRKTLSLGERIKVIDYLRGLVEPVIGDSNAAVASKVSDASGVEVNWQQISYMIEELPEMNLGAKVYVKTTPSTDEDRIAALEKRIADFESRLSVIADRIDDGAQ